MHDVVYRTIRPKDYSAILRNLIVVSVVLNTVLFAACVRVAPGGHHREWLGCPISTWEPLGREPASHCSFDRCSFRAPRWRDDRNDHSYSTT